MQALSAQTASFEYRPLPRLPRLPRRAECAGGVRRAPRGIQIPQAVVAALAVAIAGAGAWFGGARRAPAPAASILPRLAAPTPIMPGILRAAVSAESPAPFLELARLASAKPSLPKSEMGMLPEPPTASEPAVLPDASSQSAPQTAAWAHARVSLLFGRSIGWFVPFKDQPERRIVSGGSGAQGSPEQPAVAKTPCAASAARSASVARYEPSVAKYGPSVASYGPSVATYGPSVASYGPSVASYGPSVAGYGPSVASYGPSVASYGPSVASYGPSVASYGPSVAGYESSVASDKSLVASSDCNCGF